MLGNYLTNGRLPTTWREITLSAQTIISWGYLIDRIFYLHVD